MGNIMKKQHIVITLLTDDKPGVVQKIAGAIASAGGNWLESRMSQLAGKFAGILKIGIDADKIEALTTSLAALADQGIQVLIDSAKDDSAQPGRMFSFELIGADRTGIVSEISQAFSASQINIDDLETYCTSMPWSGEPLFQATGILIAPETTNKDQLLDQLHLIEDRLGLDISLTEQL